jgi:hypothetical protein
VASPNEIEIMVNVYPMTSGKLLYIADIYDQHHKIQKASGLSLRHTLVNVRQTLERRNMTSYRLVGEFEESDLLPDDIVAWGIPIREITLLETGADKPIDGR